MIIPLTRRSRRARADLLAESMCCYADERAWWDAAVGCGLSRISESVAGSSPVVPHATRVTIGGVTVLRVDLLPGQLAADVENVAHRLAPALGCAQIRVTPDGDLRVLVSLLDRDPLDELVEYPAPGGPLLLGRDEHGRMITSDWAQMPHLILQGATRSGKSWAAYSLLAQAAGDPLVIVAGCDPTGLLLRPFEGTRHDGWQVRTLRDIGAHAKLLGRLVDEMDARVAGLPADRDVCELSPDQPAILTVLEEYPGLLAAADAEAVKLGKQIRGLVGRLACEGHKAGIRLLLIAQRAEASIVNGLVRAQCEGKITFRVDNLDSVRLLHPDATAERMAAHITAPAGVALVTLPGHPLRRMRGPAVGCYGKYSGRVAAACRGD